MMIKLVIATIVTLMISTSLAEDYYNDENGKLYTIGLFGERRYVNGNDRGSGGYNNDPGRFRVDAANILAFGWDMFKSIDSENFVISPISPQILLGCLAKEVKNDSLSYRELKDNIRYKDSRELEILVDTMMKEETARALKIGSAFFVKKEPTIKKSFYDESTQKTEVIEIPNDSRYSYDRYGYGDDDDDERYGGYNRYGDRDYHYGSSKRRGGSNSNRRRYYSLPPYPFPRPLKLEQVDFKKPKDFKKQYNNWIKDATNGVIKDVDIDVSADTEMILTSAIYFKGQWLFAFNVTETIDFETPGGTKKVEAMKIRKKYHAGGFDNLDARWAAIPYNSTEALVIILPHEGKNIDEIIQKMNGSEFTEIIEDIGGYPTNSWLNVTLPKFKIESTVDLKASLEKMGIKKIFTADSALHLYENGPPLSVSAAIQKSSLEVDEKGSIGASATAFSVVALTIERDHEDSDFLINRPFIAAIIDRKYGVPYFIGKISDPTLQS